MSGYSVQTPCCWIKPRELVDLVKRRPDQVVLEVRFREIDTGIFGRRRKFRHLQRLIVDPQQLTCTVQTHPQIAVPVGAELAGDRIFHARAETRRILPVVRSMRAIWSKAFSTTQMLPSPPTAIP